MTPPAPKILRMFGDVFEYDGKVYVFLAKTKDVLYVAQVLERADSRNLNRLFQKHLERNDLLMESKPLFCFVTLRTDELKDRIASLYQPARNDLDGVALGPLNISLSKEDLRELKKTIVRKTAPLPLDLKELVKDIQV